MRTRISRVAGVVLTLVAFSGAGTEKSLAQHPRRTPVVEAVQKTRSAIVTVKVEKGGNWGRREVVGTGVVVDGRGYVVTNRHVVTGAERIIVHTVDGDEYPAKLLTEDALHDLAVLTLDGVRRLPELAFAPSSDLMVGETVIAVGHPFGYTNSVSTGIVSAIGREVTMPSGETLSNLIQTDASINPGNSGGPLLNVNGELVGINVALREGAQGIAFALPAETVQRALAKILSANRLSRVAHGLVCNERVLEDGPVRQQVLVEQVTSQSPADRAGLQRGDVIVRIADRPVGNRFDIERALWTSQAGQSVEVRVLREGVAMRASITLASSIEGQVATNKDGAKPQRPSWAVPAKVQQAKDSQ
jgi:serine protease Do